VAFSAACQVVEDCVYVVWWLCIAYYEVCFVEYSDIYFEYG
jgi:hypothetical protein